MRTWMKAGLGILGAVTAYKILGRAKWPSPGDPCFPKQIVASCSSGKRTSPPTLIVLHSTEGPNASSAAAAFQDPNAGGSSHLIVGEDGVYQCLPDDVIACGAPGANEQGLHLEMAGLASWTTAEWLTRTRTLKCARLFVQIWADRYGIPLRFVDAAGLLRGESGVTTHAEVSKAWKQTNHWDPGPNFPIGMLL